MPWELETILFGGLEQGLAERYRTMGDLELLEYVRPDLLRP